MADALPFLKLDTDFLESEEVDRFEDVTDGEGEPWHLLRLWFWLGRQRPVGDITGLAPRILAKKAGWPGEPERFTDALDRGALVIEEVFTPGLLATEQLVEAGWDGPMIRFVGWGKRYDSALAKRVRDRKRKRDARAGTARGRGVDVHSDSPRSPEVRGEERRGEERRSKTHTSAKLPTPATEPAPPEADQPAEPASDATPSDIRTGLWDHLSPSKAAKDLGLLRGLCEAHRLAFGSSRAKTPEAQDAKHLRALLRDEKRNPSDVAKALIGFSRDPWPGRKNQTRWEHLRRDFDKYLGWFHEPPKADGADREREFNPRDREYDPSVLFGDKP